MPLQPGDPAPWFHAPTPSNPDYIFDTVGGRYVLMLFLPTAAEASLAALRTLAGHRAMFDDVRLAAFVVVRRPETAASARDARGLRWFLDVEGRVSRLYGALAQDGSEAPMWLLLDPTLRVFAQAPLEMSGWIFALLSGLPEPGEHAGVPMHAPVLVLPRVFEPELCRALVELHDGQGGAFTGVMRDAGERTVAVMDELKRRRDVRVGDPGLQAAIRDRLRRRLAVALKRMMGFQATRIERYLVSRYAADEGGVFHAHRDSFTQGTAHRRFACSINLNDDFEGGDLRFPEYGQGAYRPALGGAVVFSCDLLHAVTPVTAGRRYAFLPFLFDEAGAAVRADYQRRTGDADQLGPESVL